jgi:hypothetical protein
LADDLFRVTHDDQGKPVLHADIIAKGLGAALLAELVLERRVGVHDQLLSVLNPAAPIDATANMVLAQLRDEKSVLPASTWIAFLAGDAVERVARRMVLGGNVDPVRRRTARTLWFGKGTKHVPADPGAAAWPWARLGMHIQRREWFSEADTALGGLIVAMDLHHRVLVDPMFDVEEQLRARVTYASSDMQELLSVTEAAVGDNVIAR